MKPKKALTPIIFSFATVFCISCAQEPEKTRPADVFIKEMALKHQFEESYLDDLFLSVELKPDIITKITLPAEKLPWHRYRKIFLTESRIRDGAQFWRDNAGALAAVEQRYGVPAHIIIAILGVETLYGQKTGNHRVIDALTTLAFAYPPRSQFFTGELENFLLLCREENLNPLDPLGSYAGAMGMPQFMPSSFRSYSADFDHDGRRDIWHNKNDVIASIANYFAHHGWQPGQPVAMPARAVGDLYKTKLNGNLKPDLIIEELQSAHVEISGYPPLNSKVKLLAFEQEHGDELWAVFNNFYVITRYNHSPLYAMAVFQLSEAISKYKPTSPYE
ncbi:MAG: lytic murein transglycosylase B [Methylosarcina sp.]